MIFALLGAALIGFLVFGGSPAHIKEVRSAVHENVADAAGKATAGLALDDAEKVVIAAQKEHERLLAELERLLARPDATPAELSAKLDELFAAEEGAFTELVAVRRRLRSAVTPDEWRAIFPPPAD